MVNNTHIIFDWIDKAIEIKKIKNREREKNILMS